MKIAIVCAPGVGDALILRIVSHHLTLAGFDVGFFSPHDFGRWFTPNASQDLADFDAIFLQHDNSPKSKQIHALEKPIYTFYGSYRLDKHGPLRIGFDYVSDLNRSMVDNVIASLQLLFKIKASSDNGLIVPPGLVHRRFNRRIAIHTTSGHPFRNWPHQKFLKVAHWLQTQGFEPAFLPQFSSLEELLAFIYESGFFLGNDSGPGHAASCLKIPHLIIGREERHMRHWRPGWLRGEVLTPAPWVPRWKWLKTRWKHFITTKSVINRLKSNVLRN